MFKGKRSQAALEFLMTYGWAILMMLIVIGALAYFDVLNPENFLQPKCSFPAGIISCSAYVAGYDAAATTGVVKIQLTNSQVQGMYITRVELTPKSGNPVDPATLCNFDVDALYTNYGGVENAFYLPPGETQIFATSDLWDSAGDQIGTGSCAGITDDMISRRKYKWDITVYYYPEGSTEEMVATQLGELFTNFQATTVPAAP